MLKMYHHHGEAGGSAAYWEEFGSKETLADLLRFCTVDPLRPLFERYLTPGATMLEGGCGRGQYVAYYSRKGINVVGLDFAHDLLSALHREMPLLRLCAGDVGGLPFKDAVFDLYYSGGVVEHFEGGAERALVEARRVLKPDGTLLISVPYFSPVRRVLRLARRGEWRVVAGPRIETNGAGGRRFYQYAYTTRDFRRILSAAGLRVLATQGYAILWGLYDVDPVRRLAARAQRRRGARGEQGTSGSEPVAGVNSTDDERPAPLLKRLLVAEDASIPMAGWLVRIGRWACANMMMYVCKPDYRAA